MNKYLGLIVGYYLARFDLYSLRKFDYPTWVCAYPYRDTANKLGINRILVTLF